MHDLKKAIFDVLTNAYQYGGDMTLACTDWHVDDRLMRILEAEYNIHFVEPEDKQLEI